LLYGKGGDDEISGGGGHDKLYGGAGDDTYYYSAGVDIFEDFTGVDTVIIENYSLEDIKSITQDVSRIRLVFNEGIDELILSGASGGPQVFEKIIFEGGAPLTFDINAIKTSQMGGTTSAGSATGSFLYGSFFDDTLVGNAGEDTLMDLSGNNLLQGEGGNDTYVIGVTGETIIEDGLGANRVVVNGLSFSDSFWNVSDDQIDFFTADGFSPFLILKNPYNISTITFENDEVLSIPSLLSGFLDSIVPTEETDTTGGSLLGLNSGIFLNLLGGDDNYAGTEFVDAINGGSGRDSISGQGGDDRLLGGRDNDQLIGGEGFDFLNGGEGDLDEAAYYNSPSAIIVDLSLSQNQVVQDGFGFFDTLSGIELVSGSGFNDIMNGSERGEYFMGRGGNDTISGLGGNDFLYGDNGNDIIRGDNGDDYIDGGSGEDTLLGGEGDDTFEGRSRQ
jgi:Ca2+-binding RTX toxin-like protein